jgi:hypothetical protein
MNQEFLTVENLKLNLSRDFRLAYQLNIVQKIIEKNNKTVFQYKSTKDLQEHNINNIKHVENIETNRIKTN